IIALSTPARSTPTPPLSLSLIPKITLSQTHLFLGPPHPGSSPHDLLAAATTHAGRFRRAPAARNTPPSSHLPPLRSPWKPPPPPPSRGPSPPRRSPAAPAVAMCAWPWRRSSGGGLGRCLPFQITEDFSTSWCCMAWLSSRLTETFRALSDQFYRTREHHRFVRQQVVNQQSHMYKKQSASVHARALKKVAMFGFSSRMSVTI
uniref:Uncharacterized protein n=2 Tax=Aegilops tauschii subsp. strangulata TaxID=200361 RepID=A0A453LAV8_AEGTS